MESQTSISVKSNDYQTYDFSKYKGTEVFDMHLHVNMHFDQYFKYSFDDIKHYMSTISKKGLYLMPVIGNFWENPKYCDGIKLNLEFLELVEAQFKNKIKKIVWFHPHEMKNEAIDGMDFDGVKYHPSISQVPISKAYAMLDLATEREVPFIIHTGRNEKSDIKYLLKIIDKYREVPIIAAHMGGLATPKVLHTLKYLNKHKIPHNLFLETSGAFNPNIIRYAVDTMGSNRILYGSDLPFYHPEVCISAITKAMENRPLDLEQILFRNTEWISKGKW